MLDFIAFPNSSRLDGHNLYVLVLVVLNNDVINVRITSLVLMCMYLLLLTNACFYFYSN